METSTEALPHDTLQRAASSWERVQRRLRAELGEDVYASWFKCLELAEVVPPVVTLSVPTKFLRNWIQQHFLEKIAAHFRREDANLSQIVITMRVAGIRPASRPETPARMAEAPRKITATDSTPQRPQGRDTGGHPVEPRPASELHPVEGDHQVGSPLDKRLVLPSFQVGRSNIMAHAAAMQIVQAKPNDMPVFNPLFVHASVGLGKTHLLQGAAQMIEASGRRVLYLTAERFMYGFVASLKAQTAIAFKEYLRGIDILIIDDAQFLHGPKSQQEFCHTLNALIDSGKQVIVAADRAPSDLEGLEERVQSRLAGGLVVEIGALDDALRIKILECRIQVAKAHLPAFEVPPDVIAYVARMITSNGRDLEGAVNRLLAHATLTGGVLDIPAAEEAIRDLIRHREPRRVKIEDIQRLVANHYNVSRADILSSRRTATVVRPRQIAMYLAKSLTLRSLPEIGRRFGGRDHTTVLHAVRKIEGMVTTDQELAGEIDHLKRMLQE
ncbi:MAG: chromosomal replication initiation protein DnaA [Rhizobiales bacterium PAR1]|nr:MAG: chromosomal replication initiation protein DnaA [Rhizobiales bacterium PAR1]